MTKLDKIINELISQDIKIQKINIDNEADIRELKECLAQWLKIAQINRLLHEKLTWQITSRLPFTKLPCIVNLPLQPNVGKQANADKAMKTVLENERLNQKQSENIGEWKHTLEEVEKKHGKWSQKFTEYKVENFTILDQYGVAHSSLTQYIDELGRMHKTPLHFMSDIGIVHDDLSLKNVSDCCHCQFIGHAHHWCKGKSPTHMKRNATSEKLATLE